MTKQGDNLFIGRAFHRAGAKDPRITTFPVDLLFEPLKILMRLLGERQHINRVFNRHRTELLQLAPDAHA